MNPVKKVSSAIVREDFNDLRAVVHYTKAAHELGLWESERQLIERFLPDRSTPLLEAGCGAGRVTLGLWEQGYHKLHAFDFSEELLAQAHSLMIERGTTPTLFHADATRLKNCNLLGYFTSEKTGFGGALFMFNGLMQIPGRRNRRRAMRQLAALCAPDAVFIFTTHDRDHSPVERALWRLEALRWVQGKQDPILREFGDRYFEDEKIGRTFMHLPDRDEILADLKATGWTHVYDAMRSELAKESRSVRAFSDECRFWVAKKG